MPEPRSAGRVPRLRDVLRRLGGRLGERMGGGSRRLESLAQQIAALDAIAGGPREAPVSVAGAAGDAIAALAEDLSNRQVRLVQRVAQLQSERDLLRGVVEGLDLPVFLTSPAATVTMCNRQAAELAGRPIEQVRDRSLDELFTQSRLLDLHERALTGASDRAQVAITTDQSRRIFDVSAVPVPLSGRPAGAVLTFRDITELATAVQLKTDFVANASHELRTPTASLRAAIETLHAAADDPAMLQRVLGMMTSNITRLEAMITDLLDLSRVESSDTPLRIDRVPAWQIAEMLAQMFERPCAERSLELAFQLDPALDHLRTDRHLLQLILRNLVENATKFAFEGTTIRIVGEPIEFSRLEPGATDTLWGDTRPRGVCFRVIDRGIGIPLKLQQRIFERFFQVEPSRTRRGTGRGTGLGLAIVKHAVRQLGGTIDVESVWQEGTEMIIRLPDCLPADADSGALDAP